MANWYVKRGTQTAGPLTLERLKELAAQGKIQNTDQVRKGEEGPFQQAGQIPGLIPEKDSEAWDEFEVNTQSQSQTTAPKKSNTTLIVILAIFAGGGLLIIPILIALLLPAVQQARDAARRSVSKNNLKQIGLAMHNYHDTYLVFPPGGTETTEGKPYHSWQTYIIPFMEQGRLYNQIDFDQPWTDPANQSLFQQEIPQYINPAIEEKVSPEGLGLSHYVGNKLLLKTNGNMGIRNILDGTANTIMAIETGQNFKPWGDPTNIAEPAAIMGPGNKTSFRGGNQVLMSDGAVRFISENIDPAVLKALSTPDRGEVIGEF
ncbi:MAG: DUF1559 domain-containing protein [Planctomycetes bacterium]|nr:DUF1559 domain-containing protein [Planctomycetota bacterium]MCH9724083.1 DUF1559 domain-containing protein [Planctomycetota bacterium]MCH9778139.1 DUF1559 domain-containing protein [Planctomycetota bacterium]MCH9792291.1 DUF1559 domain-containing protein [Planctomycetota bacterium]